MDLMASMSKYWNHEFMLSMRITPLAISKSIGGKAHFFMSEKEEFGSRKEFNSCGKSFDIGTCRGNDFRISFRIRLFFFHNKLWPVNASTLPNKLMIYKLLNKQRTNRLLCNEINVLKKFSKNFCFFAPFCSQVIVKLGCRVKKKSQQTQKLC